MARDQSALVSWSQYLALRTAAGFLHSFDVAQSRHFASAVGSMVYRISRRLRERCLTNLKRSYPEWSQEHVEHVAERSFRHMFQLFMVDFVLTPRLITKTSWPRYIRFSRMQEVLKSLIRNEPMIVLTGHCGNWELTGFTLAVLGYPLYALARPLDNAPLNEWVMGLREARGLRIITKWGAMPVLQNILERGGRVAFIADQNAGDRGLFVPFFGRLASSYKSIGLLAITYRVPIVVGGAIGIRGRFEYEISAADVIRPEDWEDQMDPVYYITARFNRALEQMIRRTPEQYLWVHRRWKSRPRHERLGRPMPRHLRAQLESLPWMTQQDLDHILEQSEADTAACAAGLSAP